MFKLRKTRQKLALSLTPLGAVRAVAEGTGYKNRRLRKSRGVDLRFDSTAHLANGGVWLRPCVDWARKFRPTFLPCSLRPMTLFGMITGRRICSMIRLSIKILPLIPRHSLLVQQTLNLSFTLPNYLPGRSQMF